jgi:hypothetical protein
MALKYSKSLIICIVKVLHIYANITKIAKIKNMTISTLKQQVIFYKSLNEKHHTLERKSNVNHISIATHINQ